MRGLVKSAGLYPSWKSITVMGDMPRSIMCALSDCRGVTGGLGLGVGARGTKRTSSGRQSCVLRRARLQAVLEGVSQSKQAALP